MNAYSIVQVNAKILVRISVSLAGCEERTEDPPWPRAPCLTVKPQTSLAGQAGLSCNQLVHVAILVPAMGHTQTNNIAYERMSHNALHECSLAEEICLVERNSAMLTMTPWLPVGYGSEFCLTVAKSSTVLLVLPALASRSQRIKHFQIPENCKEARA